MTPAVQSAQMTDEVSKAILAARTENRNNPNMPGTPPATISVATTTVVPPAPASASSTTVIPPAATPAAPAFDETAWLKEKFEGKFASFDDLNAALNRPPEVRFEPPTFPNDESKFVYEALVSGKELDVLPMLQNRKLAADIPTLPDEDKVRMYLKSEYGLTDAQVEREYNKLYVPVTDGADPLDIEIEQKKAAKRLKNDAATAQQYFASKSVEIKMPFTPAPPPAAPKLTSEQQETMTFGQQFITDKISNAPFEFNEPQKALTVKGKVTLPAVPMEELKSKISKSPEHFLAGLLTRYYTPDGKVNVDALTRDVYTLDNLPAIATDVAKESLEQTFKQRLFQEKSPGATGTGTPFLVAEDAEKAAAYKAMRIPIARPQSAAVPQG